MVRKILSKPAAAALILLMAVGSIAMWVAVPVFWLWVGSRMQEGSQPSLGPYLVVLAGIPITMVIFGKLLSKLNRAYGELTGTTSEVRVRLPWHRSLRDERGSGHQGTVLDVVMAISVTLAVIAFAIWFFLVAGSPMPS